MIHRQTPLWGGAVTLLFILHRCEAADGTFHMNLLALSVEIPGYKPVGNLCLLCRFGFGFSRPCDLTRDHGGHVSSPVLNLAGGIINDPGLTRPAEGFPPCAPPLLECWDWPCPCPGHWNAGSEQGDVPTTWHWHLPAGWGCTEVQLNCNF